MFKVNNKSLKQGVNCPKLTKERHQSDLVDLGTVSNIDITVMSLLLILKIFHTFSQYFIVGWVYQQKLKCRQVKIMKHATKMETISVAITGSSDMHYPDLHIINTFTKSRKAERCTDFMFKLAFDCLSVTVEDLNLQRRYK